MRRIPVSNASEASIVVVALNGETHETTPDKAMDAAEQFVRVYGGGVPSFSYFKETNEPTIVYSEFGAGKQVIDDGAKLRIEGLHAKLITGGVRADVKQQFYATGTRMAQEGYATQAGRKAEHDRLMPIFDAAHDLVSRIEGEQRVDRTVTARDIAETLNVTADGVTVLDGLALTERALRGLTARLESPSLSYLLGLMDRAKANKATAQRDMGTIAEVLARECFHPAARETQIKLRTRKAMSDIFAIVSPSYGAADAPEVVPQVLNGMPKDARGSWSYDPVTTMWELRAEVYTPTPVDQLAVGEPYQGYVSLVGRDNGTGRLDPGGGVSFIRCLNASTYVASAAGVSRVHRGRIMLDIHKILKESLTSIHVLCEAWGTARAAEVEVPKKITIEDAIPGFWRALLTGRNSELAGVLPGRTESHIKGLTMALNSERRAPNAPLNRADFGQGWTKYIQAQPADVRRIGEQAIGEWIVDSRRNMGCEVREAA